MNVYMNIIGGIQHIQIFKCIKFNNAQVVLISSKSRSCDGVFRFI